MFKDPTREVEYKSRQYKARKAADPFLVKRMNLLKKYNITLDEFNRKREAQKNCCAICGCDMPRPNVDHCHTTEQVRDLLCRSCNLAVGYVFEDIRIAESLVAYLKRWKPDAPIKADVEIRKS